MADKFLKTLKLPGIDEPYKIPQTAEDVGARSDTWMPTAAEVGAAPAGFGYGEVTRLVWWDDADGTKLEACLDEIFTNINMLDKVYRYSLVDYPACVVSGQGGYADIVCTDMLDGVPRTIIVTFYAVESGGIGGMAIATKKKHGGVWHPWEYVNPPMVEGVEYRTTERYNGKPVYTKLINYGDLPNTGNKNTAHTTTVNQQIIYLQGILSNGNSFSTGYNFDRTSSCKFWVDVTNWNIRILTEGNMSSLTATVVVKYIKL